MTKVMLTLTSKHFLRFWTIFGTFFKLKFSENFKFSHARVVAPPELVLSLTQTVDWQDFCESFIYNVITSAVLCLPDGQCLSHACLFC